MLVWIMVDELKRMQIFPKRNYTEMIEPSKPPQTLTGSMEYLQPQTKTKREDISVVVPPYLTRTSWSNPTPH